MSCFIGYRIKKWLSKQIAVSKTIVLSLCMAAACAALFVFYSFCSMTDCFTLPCLHFFHFQFFPITICRISITSILLMCCAFELCRTHFRSALPICWTSVYYWTEMSKVVLTSEQFVWSQTGSTGVTAWYSQDIGPKKKNHLWSHQTIWR